MTSGRAARIVVNLQGIRVQQTSTSGLQIRHRVDIEVCQVDIQLARLMSTQGSPVDLQPAEQIAFPKYASYSGRWAVSRQIRPEEQSAQDRSKETSQGFVGSHSLSTLSSRGRTKI